MKKLSLYLGIGIILCAYFFISFEIAVLSGSLVVFVMMRVTESEISTTKYINEVSEVHSDISTNLMESITHLSEAYKKLKV